MPLVGKDWSHIGVTNLFSAIKVCCTNHVICSFLGCSTLNLYLLLSNMFINVLKRLFFI